MSNSEISDLGSDFYDGDVVEHSVDSDGNFKDGDEAKAKAADEEGMDRGEVLEERKKKKRLEKLEKKIQTL